MRHLCHCRSLFNAAVAWGYLNKNPFVPFHARGGSPLHITAKARPWHHVMPDEFRVVLKQVPNARMRAMLWRMYGCGLRPGEAYNLTADKIDLKGRRVHIENRPATDELPPFNIKAEDRSEGGKERTTAIPEAAIPDVTKALEGSFRSGGFVALTLERFATVQRNWRLCREDNRWAGHDHRPWQNSDMANNVLRSVKL